jgi:hypothetical protein
MDATLRFLRDRHIIALEIVAARVVFVRGRGKRLTHVSKTVRDRLVLSLPDPKEIAVRMYGVPKIRIVNPRKWTQIDRRRGGRRR